MHVRNILLPLYEVLGGVGVGYCGLGRGGPDPLDPLTPGSAPVNPTWKLPNVTIFHWLTLGFELGFAFSWLVFALGP